MPWRDRNGAFSPLRLLVFLGVVLPGAWLAALFATGSLGAEPLEAATDETGRLAQRFLLLSLLITPLKQVLRRPQLLGVRRMLGVAAFAYAFSHFSIFVADHELALGVVAAEIALRPYLTVGFVALLGFSAMAATSTDGMLHRLGGKAWHRLHRQVYWLAPLAALHALLQAKGQPGEAAWMFGCLIWLLAYRVVAPEGGAPGRGVMLGLAAGAAALTAAAEMLWFALRTKVDPWQILAANLDLELQLVLGPRPALIVLVLGLVLFGLRCLPRGKAKARRRAPAPA